MKVGIMTMQRIRNYGSYLQAYGLKRLIEELGHQVEFVDFKVEPSVDKKGIVERCIILKKILQKLMRGVKKFKRVVNKEKQSPFECFIKSFEKEYIKDLGVTRERKYRTAVDVLVIGSDEVFNCTQSKGVGFSAELFGAGNNAGKVISYAASFGNTTIEKLKRYGIDKRVKELFGNFSSISVRDMNSQKIVEYLTGINPKIHLDPVLVYNFKKDIKDIVDIENYILVYAYNGRISEDEGRVIREFADSKQKRLISISGEQNFCDQYVYCRPLEMLSYFKHADYVITDTFHGTIFSVINQRQFAVLVRSDENAEGYGNQEKLNFLLEKLGLENQRVESLPQLADIIERNIDYGAIDTIIEKERKNTIAYLKEQIDFAD